MTTDTTITVPGTNVEITTGSQIVARGMRLTVTGFSSWSDEFGTVQYVHCTPVAASARRASKAVKISAVEINAVVIPAG